MSDWLIFIGIFTTLVVADLWGSIGKPPPGLRQSVAKTCVAVAAALAFGGYIYFQRGTDRAIEYITGYTLEISLSFDNVFVISLIIASMCVPHAQKNKALMFGVFGAIFLRAVFILAGSAIVAEFRWTLLLFAAFLIWTGAKMLWEGSPEEDVDVENSRVLRFIRRFVPVTPTFDGGKFFSGGMATPMFATIVLIAMADIMFAFDSIPAIFAITTDPFVVLTSNMFAVAALRSLFFVLAALVHRFEKLSTALSVVLIFIGAKVIYAEAFGGHIPIQFSLGGVLAILVGGICWSLIATRGKDAKDSA